MAAGCMQVRVRTVHLRHHCDRETCLVPLRFHPSGCYISGMRSVGMTSAVLLLASLLWNTVDLLLKLRCGPQVSMLAVCHVHQRVLLKTLHRNNYLSTCVAESGS